MLSLIASHFSCQPPFDKMFSTKWGTRFLCTSPCHSLLRSYQQLPTLVAEGALCPKRKVRSNWNIHHLDHLHENCKKMKSKWFLGCVSVLIIVTTVIGETNIFSTSSSTVKFVNLKSLDQLALAMIVQLKNKTALILLGIINYIFKVITYLIT